MAIFKINLFNYIYSGLTESNYKELNILYQKYKDQGMFIILCKYVCIPSTFLVMIYVIIYFVGRFRNLGFSLQPIS